MNLENVTQLVTNIASVLVPMLPIAYKLLTSLTQLKSDIEALRELLTTRVDSVEQRVTAVESRLYDLLADIHKRT